MDGGHGPVEPARLLIDRLKAEIDKLIEDRDTSAGERRALAHENEALAKEVRRLENLESSVQERLRECEEMKREAQEILDRLRKSGESDKQGVRDRADGQSNPKGGTSKSRWPTITEVVGHVADLTQTFGDIAGEVLPIRYVRHAQHAASAARDAIDKHGESPEALAAMLRETFAFRHSGRSKAPTGDRQPDSSETTSAPPSGHGWSGEYRFTATDDQPSRSTATKTLEIVRVVVEPDEHDDPRFVVAERALVMRVEPGANLSVFEVPIGHVLVDDGTPVRASIDHLFDEVLPRHGVGSKAAHRVLGALRRAKIADDDVGLSRVREHMTGPRARRETLIAGLELLARYSRGVTKRPKGPFDQRGERWSIHHELLHVPRTLVRRD